MPGTDPEQDGVGVVATERLVVASPSDPLMLACGRSLDHVEVAFERYGAPPDGSNVVVICHALTADAHAAGITPGSGAVGWWDDLIGPGRAIDTRRFHVLCANLLGSCLGTTGPTSPRHPGGPPWGLDFPPVTIADQVAVQRRLLAALGLDAVHAVIGPSLGGMVALQWFLDAPDQIGRTVLIATSGRLTVENRAFSAAGRQAILDDPGFDGGRYLEHGGPGPERGLAAARRFAHITYVSAAALEQKLDDDPPEAWPPPDAEQWLQPGRDVERYLEHQGNAFLRRFDALSYLYLTRPMDDFDPFGARAGERSSAAISAYPQAPHRLLSFDSDWRFGTSHSERLAAALRAAGARDVTHTELAAPWGHDAFLLDAPGLPQWLAAALA